AKADLTNSDRLAHAAVVASDENAFERLRALLVAFLDPHVDANRVAGPERRKVGPLVLIYNLRHQRILHLFTLFLPRNRTPRKVRPHSGRLLFRGFRPPFSYLFVMPA